MLYHYGIPNYFNHECSIEIEQQKLTFYFDISSKDIIYELHFTSSNLLEHNERISDFVKSLENKKISDIFSTALKFNSSKKIFPIEWILFYRSYQSFIGLTPPWSEQKQFPFNELICRCFGVYKEEITQLLNKWPMANLSQITMETKAGGGCATCVEDIKQIISSFHGEIGYLGSQKRERINNETPAKVVLKVDKWMSSLSNNDFCQITGLYGKILKVKVLKWDQKNHDHLKDELLQKYGLDLYAKKQDT